MAGGSSPAGEAAAAAPGRGGRGAGGGGGAPEPPPCVNEGFLLFGEVRARGGGGCRPGPLAAGGGSCPPECVRVEAETNMGAGASECACSGFALVLPLSVEAPDPSEPPPRLLGRVTARQRCYVDCEEDTAWDMLGVGSLQTNAGPDGAEAFCYEEFSVDRWFRAGGDFFKRVDFNLSASGPPPRTGVTYLPAGALGPPEPLCALPAVFWSSFLVLYALAILQAWIMGRSFLSALRYPVCSGSEGTTEKSSGPSSAAPVSGGSDEELFLEIPESITGTDEDTQRAEEGIDSTWRSVPFGSADIPSTRRLAPWGGAPRLHS